MKKRHIILCIMVLLIILGVIWWNIPAKFLKFVDSKDISMIAVRDGSTGARFEINKEDDISYIVEIFKNLHSPRKVSLYFIWALISLLPSTIKTARG